MNTFPDTFRKEGSQILGPIGTNFMYNIKGALKVDAFVLSQAKLFFWNAIMFMLLLFTNAKVLSNVSTLVHLLPQSQYPSTFTATKSIP